MLQAIMRLTIRPRQWPTSIFLVALSHFALELAHNFLPILYPLFIESMHLSYTQIGAIALTASLFGSLLQPIFGLLSDRWEPRLIVTLSIVWSGLIMGLVGLIPRYEFLLVAIALGALGSAAYHPAGATLAAIGSPRRLGMSLSIFSLGGSAGSALSPLVVGAGLGLIGLAGPSLLIPITLAIGWLLYLRMPGPPQPISSEGSPLKAGSQPRSWRLISLITLIVAARSWLQGALFTYLPEWLQSQGQSLETAGLALSLFLVALSVGGIAGGTLSDRFGRLPIVFVSFAAMGLLHWLLLHSSSPLRLVWVFAIGLMIGSTFPVVIAMAQEAWPGSVGLASALVLGLGWLPSGIGSWVVGIVADSTNLTMALSSLLYAPILGLFVAALTAWYGRPAMHKG